MPELEVWGIPECFHFIVECAKKKMFPLILFLEKLKFINQSIIPFITDPFNQIPPGGGPVGNKVRAGCSFAH